MRETGKKRYVCGFLLWGHQVLLTRKLFPDWQRGLLNGVGGKVEKGEGVVPAMQREGAEETGLEHLNWGLFCLEGGRDYQVWFLRCRVSHDLPQPVVPKTNDVGEELGWYNIHDVTHYSSSLHNSRLACVGNLRWLLPLAQDWRDLDVVVSVQDDIVQRPTW